MVKLCDPSLTRAIPQRFRDEFHMIKRYANVRLLHLFYFRDGFIMNLLPSITVLLKSVSICKSMVALSVTLSG